MTSRVGPLGFGKINSRRDPEFEASMLQWVEHVIDQRLPHGDIEDILHDGVILCRLMKQFSLLQEYNIRQVSGTGNQFRISENIGQFLKAAREFGVRDVDIFQTVDLLERRNISKVVECLLAIRRIAEAKYGSDHKFQVSRKLDQ